MVGPEDAGACSGRNPKLLPVPALEPVGQDGKMIRATGGFGGGVGAVEPPAEEEEEEEEEETPPQQLLRRYLAAAGGGQLESALCSRPLPARQPRAAPPPAAPRPDACPRDSGSKRRGAAAADVRAPRHRGMTNGDSGFLAGQDSRDLEEARGLARAGGRDPSRRRLRPQGPGDEGADGSGSASDWAAPLEDPLRSCCLAAADADKPQGAGGGSEGGAGGDGGSSGDSERPGAGAGAGGCEEGPSAAAAAAAGAERISGGAGAEPRPGVPDVRVNSRNTFEVSRDHLPPASPPVPAPAAEQGAAGTSARARRSGGLADFFARNLFPKRTKELKSVVHSAPGWKLFGKVPPRENLQKTSKIIQQEYEARTGRTCKPPPQSSRRKNFEFEPLSTTALILEDRPSNLFPKRTKELKSVVHSAPGWKLFGKVPPRENLQKTSKIIQQSFSEDQVRPLEAKQWSCY